MFDYKTLSRTAIICRYAVCLTLLIVCAQILVPLPATPVPVTLSVFMIFVTGGLMGPKHGTLCVLIYIFMGLIGLPVFAGFASTSALLGPTGGYIIGYIPMTFITGLCCKKSNLAVRTVGMIGGLFVLYLFGTLFYSVYASVNILTSLMLTAAPFIVGDTIKLVLASLVLSRLAKIRL